MIDTQTGRLWKYRCAAEGPDAKCIYYAWTEETVQGISIPNKEFEAIVNRIEENAKKSQANQ
jgi:hypothetical protein